MRQESPDFSRGEEVNSSGDWFAVEVPEIGGLFTQVRRLDEVEGMVRDAAKMFGVGLEDCRIHTSFY